MKLCKDCKHVLLSENSIQYSRCQYPDGAKRNYNYLVTGEGAEYKYPYCTSERVTPCCIVGKNWEAKV